MNSYRISIKAFFNQSTFYIICWLLYNLQGTFYESGSIISQLLLAVILLMSFLNTFKVIKEGQCPQFFKGLKILLLMFTIYGLFLIVLGEELTIKEKGNYSVRNFVYLKDIYMSLLPIYSFYWYSKKALLNIQILKVWLPIFFLVAILQYYRVQQESIAYLLNVGSRFDSGTNNCGYLLLSLMPATFLYKNKPLLQYIGIGVCMFFIMMSVKRGAIIIGVLVLFIILYMQLKNVSSTKKILIFALFACILLMGNYFVEYLINNNDYFYSRLTDTLEGNSSHRDEMYSNLWDIFLNRSSLVQMVFGHGAWGTLKVNMNFAHNDWFEILTNQGVLGISIFIYFWKCLYVTYKKTTTTSSKHIILLFGIITFLRTFFSMSYSDMSIYMTCILGCALLKVNQFES